MARNMNGLMRGRVRIGYDADGKAVDKYISAHSEEELETAKAAIREHYIFGEQIPKEMLFYEYAMNWYQLKKEPFISASSKSAYKSCFVKHILPEYGMRQMKAISAKELQEFLNKARGMSKSFITLLIGILKGIFSTAYAEGAIPRDVIYALIRPKTSPADEKRSLTPEETQRILVTIQEHPEGLLLGVLYYLGLRRGEALGLKWGDFDFESDMVHIQRDIDFTDSVAREDTLKTTAADRFVPVPKELKELLLPRKGKEDGFVFHTEDGGPIPQGTFKRMWLRLMLASDCVEWREVGENTSRPGDIVKNVKATITPHWLRHNYVTMLYESGVDPLVAMKIVGHRDYQTTANIYTHLKEETLRKASVNLNEVFRKRVEN